MSDSRILTTLCYIEKDEQYLMMHRVSKKNDANAGKWIGVGGHLKEAESPDECLIREVQEETGLTLTAFSLRGIITFVSDEWGYEYMFLYTADGFTGAEDEESLSACREGILHWIPKEQVMDLNLWEGDRVFLKLLLENAGFFTLKLVYRGDELIEQKLRCENKMTDRIYESLSMIAGREKVKVSEPMKNHTTFRIGGNADYFVTPDTIEELQGILKFLNKEEIPFFILGNGSNLLVSDDGFRGVIIQIGKNFQSAERDGCRLRVRAGISMARLAAFALENSLTGLEFASGIPGTAGGGAIMNAGAYGGEMKQVMTEVLCMDRQGELFTLRGEEMELSYRESRMKREGLIVLELVLELAEGDQEAIRQKHEELKEARTSKQPLEFPSAGSTFKRPEGYFAGKLIMDAGLKGFQIGGARVSEKHAGFVINAGGATAADVKALMDHVTKTVQDQFGVTLEPEVLFVG